MNSFNLLITRDHSNITNWNGTEWHYIQPEKRCITPVIGDSFCFLNTIQAAIFPSYNVPLKIPERVNIVCNHLTKNVKDYLSFQCANINALMDESLHILWKNELRE